MTTMNEPIDRTQKILENWGALRSLQTPAGWNFHEDTPDGDLNPPDQVWVTPPSDPDAKIMFYWRGRPIAPAVAQHFADTLSAGSHTLTTEEVLRLKSVMGTNNVGNNQYTNDGARGTTEFAACKLLGAQVTDLNGSPVLSVRCTFQDINGNPGKEFLGIYFDARPGQGNIQQIFFQTATLAQHLLFLPNFEAMLRTITWK